MESLLAVIVAGALGGLLYTFINKIGNKGETEKRNAAVERAKTRFANLSQQEKETLNLEYSDEKILELYIFEELQKAGLI